MYIQKHDQYGGRMKLKSLVHEDFVQYKKPSMFMGVCYCDFKCERESNCDCHCQNSPAYSEPIVDCSDEQLIKYYMENNISEAVVIGGFEPFLQFNELIKFVDAFRKVCEDDIVIYTGYTEDELEVPISKLKTYKNIILKVGRYVPNQEAHLDPILGVKLASDNQYAVRL